ERLADAAPALAVAHIHGVLDAVPIPAKGPPATERGVAEHAAVIDGDEHRETVRFALAQPGGTVVDVDGFLMPDGGGVQHRPVVDGGDLFEVAGGGIPNQHALRGAQSAAEGDAPPSWKLGCLPRTFSTSSTMPTMI